MRCLENLCLPSVNFQDAVLSLVLGSGCSACLEFEALFTVARDVFRGVRKLVEIFEVTTAHANKDHSGCFYVILIYTLLQSLKASFRLSGIRFSQKSGLRPMRVLTAARTMALQDIITK